MASLIYNSAIDHVIRGAISFEDDDFRVMLCTSGYTPSKSHSTRADVTNEVTGEGYGAGGISVSIAVLPNRQYGISVELGGALWMHATIKARYAVYYRRSGGELIAVIDFEKDVRAVRGTFSITPSTITFGY